MSDVQATISDWSAPPGETIRALLAKSKISYEDFARSVGLRSEDVRQLLNGSIAIDALLAQELERTLGGSSKFWLKREADFRLDVSTSKNLSPDSWLKTLPVKEMRRWGWLSPSNNDLLACQDFFGVSTIREWKIKYGEMLASSNFRRSSSSEDKTGIAAAWLRYQEVRAMSIVCQPWDPERFKSSLEEIKSLTFEKDPKVFLPKLQDICARSGVAVVAARAPSGSTISGAAMFLSERKAMICLSFRHLSDDHVWFTFFHEAGHLLLHEPFHPFVDDDGTLTTDKKEEEANQFAAEIILPNNEIEELVNAKDSKFALVRISKKLNVCTGLLVGQLQKRGYIPYSKMNSLKRRYSWATL